MNNRSHQNTLDYNYIHFGWQNKWNWYLNISLFHELAFRFILLRIELTEVVVSLYTHRHSKYRKPWVLTQSSVFLKNDRTYNLFTTFITLNNLTWSKNCKYKFWQQQEVRCCCSLNDLNSCFLAARTVVVSDHQKQLKA